MNETVETPAVETAVAEPQVETTQEQPAVEAAEPQVETPPEVTTPTDPSRLDDLLDALGEIPDEPSEALLENLDENTIKNLPASMKGLFKHMVAAERKRVRELEEKMNTRSSDLDKKFEDLKEQNRVVIRNRAQLNEVLMDPKFQEYLQQADVPEEQMADPYSKEGIEQRIKKGVAEAMREFQKPIAESATRAQQMAKYQDFVAANPMMQDRGFKTEVRDLMQQRRDSGTPVSLEDAYALVERGRMLAEQQKQTAKERLKRSQSARQVSRSTVSSSNDNQDPVPKWVTEKGYQGVRGSNARILYLRDNPAALQKLRAQQKSRR
tara:strand:+ start:4596 stop:5564 length:969 start_codon:yes stop_codon:yes gene_type:complete